VSSSAHVISLKKYSLELERQKVAQAYDLQCKKSTPHVAGLEVESWTLGGCKCK